MPLVVTAGCTRKVHITGNQPRMTLTPNIDMNKHSRIHLNQSADIPRFWSVGWHLHELRMSFDNVYE